MVTKENFVPVIAIWLFLMGMGLNWIFATLMWLRFDKPGYFVIAGAFTALAVIVLYPMYRMWKAIDAQDANPLAK